MCSQRRFVSDDPQRSESHGVKSLSAFLDVSPWAERLEGRAPLHARAWRLALFWVNCSQPSD